MVTKAYHTFKKNLQKVVWKLKLSIFKPCNVAKIFQIEVKLNKNKEEIEQ